MRKRRRVVLAVIGVALLLAGVAAFTVGRARGANRHSGEQATPVARGVLLSRATCRRWGQMMQAATAKAGYRLTLLPLDYGLGPNNKVIRMGLNPVMQSAKLAHYAGFDVYKCLADFRQPEMGAFVEFFDLTSNRGKRWQVESTCPSKDPADTLDYNDSLQLRRIAQTLLRRVEQDTHTSVRVYGDHGCPAFPDMGFDGGLIGADNRWVVGLEVSGPTAGVFDHPPKGTKPVLYYDLLLSYLHAIGFDGRVRVNCTQRYDIGCTVG